MAQITQLDSKLAEVLGLAQAAQQATKKVSRLAKSDGETELVTLLDRMGSEAKETEKRCKAAAEKRDGKKTAINRKARETKTEAGEMMEAYLGGDDVDALDGFEFLTMAEAGELDHWEVVKTMATKAKDRGLVRLADWATPIQQNHVQAVRTSSLKLAESENPNEPAEGRRPPGLRPRVEAQRPRQLHRARARLVDVVRARAGRGRVEHDRHPERLARPRGGLVARRAERGGELAGRDRVADDPVAGARADIRARPHERRRRVAERRARHVGE